MRIGYTLGFALHKIIKDIDGNGLIWWCPIRNNNYFYCYFVLLTRQKVGSLPCLSELQSVSAKNHSLPVDVNWSQ